MKDAYPTKRQIENVMNIKRCSYGDAIEIAKKENRQRDINIRNGESVWE